MATLAEMFVLAQEHHQAGGFVQAEELCQQVVQADPSHIAAWRLLAEVCQAQGNFDGASNHLQQMLALQPYNAGTHANLGNIFVYQGKYDDAILQFQQALRLDPDNFGAHFILAVALHDKGKLDEAVVHYRQALRVNPNVAEAHSRLGFTLMQQGRLVDALTCFRQALWLDPDLVDAHHHLGACHHLMGNFEQAAESIGRALTLKPHFTAYYFSLGAVYQAMKQIGVAVTVYEQVLRMDPRSAEAHCILGDLLRVQGRLEEAAEHCREALRINPDFAGAHNNLGLCLGHQGQHREAEACHAEAIRLQPDYAEAHSNLACVLLIQTQLGPAISSFRQALRFKPNLAPARSNLLFCLNYDPETDPDRLFEEHCLWGELHGPKTSPQLHDNDPSPDRRMRIGYLSPDFRHHPVSRYFESVLAHHNPQNVEAICYADLRLPDSMTTRLQKLAHGWRWICDQSESQVARQIRDDRIDILVDLAGHTTSNGLLVMALKPAPVQATWLGYMNTTGLTTIDYRLTDDVLDPPGQPRRDTEELLRLPGGFCCFTAPWESMDVTPLPALRQGHLTFGSLNNSMKLNPKVLGLWSKVLQALPTSRLLMFRDTFTPAVQDHLRKQFAERGIAGERLDIRQGVGLSHHLNVYGEIDVSLDTFPYTGGVTTCESLWMGVPVLSLSGVRPAGRHSASLLSRVGLKDWTIETPEQYLTMAVSLPQRLEELAQLRAGLRDRVVANLCNGAHFTQALEDAYRNIWRRWCAQQPT